QASIDGQAVPVTPREPNVIRIDLPAPVRGHECVVELWYSMPTASNSASLLVDQLRPAILEEATPPRRTYWEVALPTSDYLLTTPSNLVKEMAWTTQNWQRGPRPLLDQRQLETWIGSSRQDELPDGANTYLFGTLAQAPTLDVVVADRRLILAAASGLALAAGLLLIYVPWLRGATPLLIAAVVLAALALAYPDAALLLGRAALLGLGACASVWLWRWLAQGRPAWTIATHSTATAPALGPSPSTTLPRGEKPAPITTATAPAGLAAGDSRA
ncbi:MAG TPA: hypothetical protein VFV87_08610, partial [Pirellulaceae bacterium]|nr:hypothetical protein [Pirellulaceae bacterium]